MVSSWSQRQAMNIKNSATERSLAQPLKVSHSHSHGRSLARADTEGLSLAQTRKVSRSQSHGRSLARKATEASVCTHI
eukprot:1186731-Prorocentrum_minimum.AAC.3